MAENSRTKSVVVLQLSGGNDPLNTVVPYTDGHYYDQRPKVNVAPEDVLPIDGEYGFHPSMGAIKPARPMLPSAWGSPPARGGCRSASPRPPHWYTS